MQWLTDMTKGFERLRGQYQKAILVGGPEASLAATARYALVTSRLVEGLAGDGMMTPECGRSPNFDRLEPLESNVVSASERCALLASTYAIDDDWAAYCRWELQRIKPGENVPLIELFPDPVYMGHARENLAYRPVEIEKVDSPPRLRPRPVKRRCLEKKVPDEEKNDGRHLASIFGRDESTKDRLAYPDDFIDKLTARFPPPWLVRGESCAKNRGHESYDCGSPR
jgi:hypothetical protein